MTFLPILIQSRYMHDLLTEKNSTVLPQRVWVSLLQGHPVCPGSGGPPLFGHGWPQYRWTPNTDCLGAPCMRSMVDGQRLHTFTSPNKVTDRTWKSMVGRWLNLGGGFRYFLFSPRSLGKWSNLTSIFFKPPTRNTSLFGKGLFSRVKRKMWVPLGECPSSRSQILPHIAYKNII